MVLLDTLLFHYLTIDSRKSRGGCKKRQTNVKRRSQCGQFYSRQFVPIVLVRWQSTPRIYLKFLFLSPDTNEDPVSYPDVDYCFSCKRISTADQPLTFFSVNGSYYKSAKVFLLLQPRIQFHFAPCVTFI